MLLSPERRSSELKQYSLILFLQIVFLVYYVTIAVIAHNKHRNEECAESLVKWFTVFVGFYFIDAIMTSVRICAWKCAKDPCDVEATINIVYVLLAAVPEIACTIYGFVMIQKVSICRVPGEIYFDLTFYTALIMLITSSIYFLGLILVILVYAAAYY